MGVMRRLDGRWKLPILFRLFGAPMLRFSELQRGLAGVSHKMLAEHLHELEADGLVIRTDHEERPLRVDYRLSALGEALRPVLAAMRDLGRQWPREMAGTTAVRGTSSAKWIARPGRR